MRKKLFMMLAFILIGGGLAFAQNNQVTGIVTYAVDGEPVMGASVVVKGTMIGVSTDENGKYVINVPASANTLVFSFVGLITQEVAVTSATINVALVSDASELDEVVVTAMGFSRERKALGYAIQEVKSDELTKAGSASVTSSLSGKVAGLNVNQFGGSVGASSRISIRGNSSLSADQQPLIVVNGVPIVNDTQRSGDNTYNGVDYGSGLNDINPEDIESISVLKGGSAALYGMRAGNGVILITTKSGKGAQGVEVSYDVNLTMDRVTNIANLQNSYGQGHDGDEWHWKANQPGMSYQDYAVKYGFDYSKYVNDGYDESWGPRLDAGLKISQFDSDGAYVDWISRPDNVKDFFQTGFTMNHVVSLMSHSEKATTRASISYRDQNGTVPNTDQKRYSAQFSTQLKLNKWISYDLSATYTRTESDNLITQGYGNNPINSLVAWSGRQINMQSLKENWDQKDPAGNYTFYNWIDYYHMNPYFSVYENTNSYKRNRFFGKTSLYYQPLEWLKFEGRIGFDYYNAQIFERHFLDRGDWPHGGFAQNTSENTELNADFIASINKTWDKLSFTGIFGANYRDLQYQYTSLGASALTVPGIYTIANKVGDASTGMDHSHVRSNSVYANVSFGWDGQLYLDASARNDWSSTIHDPFFYPSVSLSWIPTATFESLKGDILSFWKLRGGLAQIGSATGAYRNSYYYYAAGSSFNGVAQMYKSYTYPNFDLRPEKVTTWEIGTEIGFFDNRLYIDAAYYQKKTEDQILSVTTNNTIGFSSMLVNAGRIDNKGVEVLVRGDIFRNNDGFNWTSTFNFAKDESKIIELYKDEASGQELTTYGIGWTWGIATQAIVGEKWGALVGTGYSRVTQEDVDNNLATKDQLGAIKLRSSGYPTTAGSSIIGNVTPDFTMGWRNDFSYKGFNFGFMFDLRIGGDIWSQSMSHSYAAGTAYVTAANGIREKDIVAGVDVATHEQFVMQDASGNWVENTIKTDAYKWFNGCGCSETYVFDGSYLKLREGYIGYTLPNRLLRSAGFIKRCTVSLIGTNLALLWVDSSNTLRIDPETGGVSSDSRGVGFEQASTPGSRSFGLKLGLTF